MNEYLEEKHSRTIYKMLTALETMEGTSNLRHHLYDEVRGAKEGSCQDPEIAETAGGSCPPAAVAGVRRGGLARKELKEYRPHLSLIFLFSCLCFPLAKPN